MGAVGPLCDELNQWIPQQPITPYPTFHQLAIPLSAPRLSITNCIGSTTTHKNTLYKVKHSRPQHLYKYINFGGILQLHKSFYQSKKSTAAIKLRLGIIVWGCNYVVPIKSSTNALRRQKMSRHLFHLKNNYENVQKNV